MKITFSVVDKMFRKLIVVCYTYFNAQFTIVDTDLQETHVRKDPAEDNKRLTWSKWVELQGEESGHGSTYAGRKRKKGHMVTVSVLILHYSRELQHLRCGGRWISFINVISLDISGVEAVN